MKKSISRFPKFFIRCKFKDGGTFFKMSKNINNIQYIFNHNKEKKIENTVFVYEVKYVIKKNPEGKKIKFIKIPFEKWKKEKEEDQWVNNKFGWETLKAK